MSDSTLRTIAKQKPMVLLNRTIPEVACLISDNQRGVRRAAEIGTGSGVGAAVRHALQALPALPGPAAERLAIHACGLLAVALDQPGVAGRGAGRRSHAQAVDDIEEHLADDDLSPAATARRLGVSVRTLHGIFAGHELSYAATVRHRRLEQAYRDLRDPARAHLRIIDIATDAGFADVTSFHRAFRRRYGDTPAQTRQPRNGAGARQGAALSKSKAECWHAWALATKGPAQWMPYASRALRSWAYAESAWRLRYAL